MLPVGYPGVWNYWVPAAGGRGGGDTMRTGALERLQFSLRKEPRVGITGAASGVEIESVTLRRR